MRRPAARPVLITDAEQSPDDQLRRREIRYVIMMGTRIVCLIVAGVLVTLRVPMLGLWLTLCVLGAAVLPWLAVILANDRPPKQQHRLRGRLAGSEPAAPNALSPASQPKVIDHDP